MFFRHTLFALAATVASTITLTATTTFAQAPPPAAVRVGRAELQTVQEHHRVTGSLRAVARGDVAALEDGRVVEVTVREGAVVNKGETIGRTDARRLEATKAELQATLKTIDATVAQHEAELRQARLDLARSAQIVQSRAITLEEHQHRETEVAVAEARLSAERRRYEEVRSQLDLLEVRLADTVVRAPYNARVVDRHAEPGEWIRAGEPLVTLVSTGPVEAWLDVPERYASQVDPDATNFTVAVRGSQRTFTATSAKFVPEVHPRTRTFQFVLTIDNDESLLTPGMSVDAWLPVAAERQGLTVPKDAVIRDGQAAYVYKAVNADGQQKAMRAAVVVAFETGSLAVVDSDALSHGDHVVVEGNERLLPGTPIAFNEPQSGAEPADARLAEHAR